MQTIIQKLRHFKLPVAIAAFATIGVLTLVFTHAATNTASFEPEDGTLSSAELVADTEASGGNAVRFGSASPTTVQIGAQTFLLSGTNIARGSNQIVRYTYSASQTVTPTNQYGVEVVVNLATSKVTSVNNRISTGSTAGTSIPADSYVLSGHGGPGAEAAGAWLLQYATVGATVTLTGSGGTTDPGPTDPGGTTGTAPMPYPTKAVAVYHMMWSTSGSPQLSTTPANVNVINMAFAQNDPPALTGWASQSEASFIADAKALRARGVRMVVSVGGAGGHINVANRQAFVNGIMAINSKVPLDGIDWDLEGPSMTQSDVVWISTELKRLRGSDFAVTMAPNGSNIDQYRTVAVALNNAGALDMIGQQFYDSVVTNSAMMTRLAQLRSAGIPENKIGIGMMVGDADTYWTVDECISAVNTAKSTYPNLRGGYLWEAGRAGTADWANRVGNLLKQ